MVDQSGEQHPSPWRQRWLALRTSLREYWDLRAGDGRAAYGLLTGYALAGWQYRLGLLALIVGVLAAAWLTVAREGLPLLSIQVLDGQALTLPVAALWLALMALAVAWTCLLHGAAAHGLAPFAIAAIYALYYGLYPAMGLSATPWFGLLPVWLGLLGGAQAARQRSLWRHLWMLLLALVVGITTYAPLGLNRLFPSFGIYGRLALGVIWFALLSSPLVARLRIGRWRIAPAVTLALFVLLYALAAGRGPAEEVLSLTYDAFHTLLGLVSLYWFWMGLGLFTGAQDLVTWGVNASRRLLSARWLSAGIVLFWLVRLLVDYLVSRTPPLWLLQGLDKVPGALTLLQGFWALPWSPPLVAALAYDLYVMLATLALAVGLWLAHRLTNPRLVALFGYSLLALLVLVGGMQSLFLAAAGQDDLPTLWPVLLYLAGTVWELVASGAGLVSAGEGRRPLFLGFLLTVLAIATVELSSASPLFRTELTLNTLLGALYLGLPYLLYRYVYQRQASPPLAGRGLLVLFALGMATALPALWFGGWYVTPLLWCLVLVAVLWREGRWEHATDGLAYGLVLALGHATYTTHPVLIPVPAFARPLSALMYAQSVFADNVIYPWDLRWWLVLLTYALSGGLLGLLAWRAHRAAGWRAWAWLALGYLLSLAVLTAARQVIGTA